MNISEFKKIIYYAIIPAFIAGIFTVAPKLYDEITEPKATLSYQITKGPILVENNIQKTIYAINIKNDGKKPLTGISSIINTKNSIEAITIYEHTGLNPKVNKDKQPYSVSVETLHPKEFFSISLMVVANNTEPKIEFILRSKETLGFVEEITNKTQSIDFLSALAAALSVFAMALYFLVRLKSGKIVPYIFNDKTDIIYYLLVKLELLDIVELYRTNDDDITFRRLGDILFAKANSNDAEKKKNAILGLKSLLLINNIAESSKKLIVRNIKILEENDYSQDEIDLIKSKSEKISNEIELRDLIDDYVKNSHNFIERHT
ncbi:MAG: hypothetical protein H8E76_09840 [Helicobacteraceae bacterium]|nr:hypothetical protein [Candidatus Sulfurimonas ponti]MBL6973243.1 hypothetical protein [Sulfurimonas sp.]